MAFTWNHLRPILTYAEENQMPKCWEVPSKAAALYHQQHLLYWMSHVSSIRTSEKNITLSVNVYEAATPIRPSGIINTALKSGL